MRSSTLRVRKLPPELSNAEKIDLLKHFGANDVVCIGTKNATAFATFESVDAASVALKRLHQLEVLGYLLNVDFAASRAKTATGENSAAEPGEVGSSISSGKPEEGSKSYESFLQRLNAWSLGLDLTQPPPAHLSYQYPPPTMDILANIARALCAVPKLYTQVLHLMNKMNLPSPFHGTCEEYRAVMVALLGTAPHVEPVHEFEPTEVHGLAGEEAAMQTSTSESEMESDGESTRPRDALVVVAKRPRQPKRVVKRPKLQQPPSAPKPSASKAETNIGEVFEVPEEVGKQKKIELRLTSAPDVTPTPETKPQSEMEGFGILFPPMPEPAPQEEPSSRAEGEETDGSTISRRQLRNNRIPERDREVLSVFRGYQAGPPSCRLYVKNLAKTVTVPDLYYIFRAFLGNKPQNQEENNMFDVRLMTEGRMKGQAFVTFPHMSQAQSALKETNGYILKDKPMVVQFARSAKPKSTAE